MTQTTTGNIIITGLWKTKNGHYQSMPVDAKPYDTLQKVLELGGKFIIRNRTEEAIRGAKDPSKTPVAYLEFVPAAEVEAFKVRSPGFQGV